MSGNSIDVWKWLLWGTVATAAAFAPFSGHSIAEDALRINGAGAQTEENGDKAAPQESLESDTNVASEKEAAPGATQDEAGDLELAARLLETQKAVAELKRRDLLEAGVGDEVRPKFVQALKQYEQLREEVLRRRATRAAKQPVKSDGQNFELLFNGVTSYVELPTLKYGGDACTIEAIVSPTPIKGTRVNPETHGYAHYMAIVADTEFGGIELSVAPDQLSLDVRSEAQGGYVQASRPCLPFVYSRMHVAAVVDDAEIRLYQNGKLVAKSEFEHPVAVSPFTLRIGCSPHPVTECHEMFCGRIDEVRISNVVRYADDFEPQPQFKVDDETVALYHFDEGHGDQLRDASGNGHHGIIHDARWVRVGD